MLQKKLRKMGAWVLAFALAVGPVQGIPVKAEESQANLALEATATASDTESGNEVYKINDGKSDTRWAANQGNTERWVQLEWDSAQKMKSFSIAWERRTAQEYCIEISNDGESWQPVYERTQIPNALTEKINLASAVTAKYLRLRVTSINTNDPDTTTSWQAISIWEFEVYEGEIPDNRTDIEKFMDSLSAPEVNAGDTRIEMPKAPEGGELNFYADYEQVVGADGTIYTPLEDKVVKGFYELTMPDDGTAQSNEYNVTIPGQYTADSEANAKPAVIPELQEWHGKKGDFALSKTGKLIVGDASLLDVAKMFQEDYHEVTGFNLSEVKTGSKEDVKAGDFYFGFVSEEDGLGKEGYAMDIDDVVFVEAEQGTGVYWATRTILQILKQTNGIIPKGLVRDYPKFEVRAFSIDVGRKPFTLDALYEFAENMSWYKMNSLQVHLSDNLIFHEDYPTLQEAADQSYAGFRLESDVVNEDTGKSATSEDVYYTKEDFRDFIQTSRVMGVDIVPEFDMPAHALPFTRAFPEFMTKKAGGSHSYLIEEIDLSNEGATPWAQSIWNDYFEGEDPIFDEQMTVHIGTDEFHGVDGQAGKEMFRKFSDDMIKFVQGKGRTVRMWGSLSNKSGETPVASKDVQLNIWNTGYANPKAMYDLGYDLINTLEGPNYIVPAAGYYNDYINAQSIYNTWKPNVINNLNIKAGDDQILGGCYAIWHDSIDTRGNGISQYDSFDRFFKPLPSYGAKLWGDGADRNYSDFTKLAEKTGTAPGTTLYGDLDYNTSVVADYTFDETLVKDSGLNGFDLAGQVNVEQANADQTKAMKLKGGASYAETPEGLDLVGSSAILTMRVKMDEDAQGEQILCESKSECGIYGAYAFKASQINTGKVGYSREGYDFSFDYTLPAGEWHTLQFCSGQDSVSLYVDGELVDNNPDIYFANHPTTELSAKLSSHNIRKTATMLVPLGRIGSKTNSFKGEIDYVTVTGTKETSGEYGKLSREGWTAAACSTHATEGSKEAVLDGDNSTYWHQDYASDTTITEEHHWFEVTLPEAKEISRLTYLPRQDSVNGRIYEYSIEVIKEDGTEETVISHETWANNSSLKTASFETVKAKKVKLRIHRSEGSHATIAELNLYGPMDDATLKAELDQGINAEFKEDDYTDGSWKTLQDAKQAAREVKDFAGSTTDDYIYVYEKLQQAIAGLTQKPSTRIVELAVTVEDAKQKLKDTSYTAESLAALKKKINAAERIIQKGVKAGKMEIVNTIKALQNVKLVTKVSVARAELEIAVADAKIKLTNITGYTAASVSALQQALKDAESVLANSNATLDELTAALTALKGKELVKEQPSTDDKQEQPAVLQTGQQKTVGGSKYKVANADKKEVTLTKGKNTKNVKVGATVTIDGVTCKITKIADNAFKNCKKVKTVEVGSNVTTVGKNAFYNCTNLTTVTIGKNVKTVNAKAFYNCKKLKNITFKGTKAPKVGSKAFKGSVAKCKVTVPKKMAKKQLNTLKSSLKKAGIGKNVTYKKK